MDYAGIILKKENKILLQLRDEHCKNPNMWGIFGGGIEKGETPEEAIIREINEELSIHLDMNHFKLLIEKDIKNKRYYIFIADFVWDGKKVILNEGKSMKFFSCEDIKNKKNVVKELRELIETHSEQIFNQKKLS
ncbi:NUDIX domain-containing protein [Candidatus Pacearchaeota archaeon]|nr:NUDIX domain-containing protein [Candidatus Pacearchaeota archaeon]